MSDILLLKQGVTLTFNKRSRSTLLVLSGCGNLVHIKYR